MSIVLVIIGILIAGILVGQSLTESSKISKTVSMLGQFDASVGVFIDKYKDLPGDTPLLCTGCDSYNIRGNGDGLLSDNLGATRGCLNPSTWLYGEIGFFWPQLSLMGLKTTGGGAAYAVGAPDNATAETLVNTYIPKIPLGTNVGIVPCGESAGKNHYIISRFFFLTGKQVKTNSDSALKGSEAYAIDNKIDDGKTNAGNIRGANNNPGSFSGLGPVFNGLTCQISAGQYNVASTTGVCGLAIRIGTTSGNLQ